MRRSGMTTVRVLQCAGVMLLTPAASLAAAGDLAGEWIVQWGGDPKNENAMTLRRAGDRLQGTYVNDEKAACTVTGNADSRSSRFAVTIVCPKWDIRMEGTASPDAARASGDYQAYIGTKGRFSMRRK